MGGAVSSGRDNNELIDNLMSGNYIRSQDVERAFRALDRADYMTPEARDQAYKDLAWRSGLLHMSAPCIYSEVMEGLELKPGLSFLNVGSGTGYLSTLVGLVLGSSGTNHGVEVHHAVVEYATNKMQHFLENSPSLDEFDFCEPKFYCGNGLCLAPLQAPYDRVYCGAGCPDEYQNYFKQLIKVGGVLVMPLNDNLVQVRRVSAGEWRSRTLLNVSFAELRVPARPDHAELIRLDEQCPVRLQALSRAAVRRAVQRGLAARAPELREPERARAPPAKRQAPRRICIPLDDDSDADAVNALHDLDPASGASEMNALLSLVLSMGHNRVAGALRFDQLHDRSRSSSSSASSEHSSRSPRSPRSPHDSSDDDDGGGDLPLHAAPAADRSAGGGAAGERDAPLARSVIMFEFRDSGSGDTRAAPPAAPAAAATPAAAAAAAAAALAADDCDSDGTDDIGVPNEVEIYLGRSSAMPGTSRTECDKGAEWKREREHSSDEEPRPAARGDEKRQKFDSGLGEENTPSSGSSPDGTGAASGDDTHASTDELCEEFFRGRRRRQKRGRGGAAAGARSSSSEGEEEGGEGGAGAEGARRPKRRAGAAAGGAGAAHAAHDARRLQYAVMMKRCVKELPLPYALKLYVNLNRAFEV